MDYDEFDDYERESQIIQEMVKSDKVIKLERKIKELKDEFKREHKLVHEQEEYINKLNEKYKKVVNALKFYKDKTQYIRKPIGKGKIQSPIQEFDRGYIARKILKDVGENE